MQDLERESGKSINGLVVSDHRNNHQDNRLRALHKELLHSDSPSTSNYANLIEELFLAPSHHSVGIQFADLIAGAIFRKCESNDERFYNLIKPLIRTSRYGKIEGYGLVYIPIKTT